MNQTRPDFPVRTDPVAIERLRSDLEGAQYSVLAIESLLGAVGAAALRRTQLIPARVAVQNQPSEPLAHLVTLFLLGLEVTNEQLGSALPALGVKGAADLGLVKRQGAQPGDQVRAAVDLRPYAARDAVGEVNWWLAADLGEEALGEALPAHHVLGVGGAAKTLARVAVRDPKTRALDLGTGSGIQALHLTRHCRSVVATDISRRALAYARFNLTLNGVAPTARAGGPTAQVELRHGSLLEPVADAQFDLIVSNPPFVITPPNSGLPAYEYRDGARRGDQLVENLVTDIGAYLKPGGIAQFLGNWEHRGAVPWQERLSAWLDAAERAGFPLDAWIVEREVQDPAQYAETWLADGGCDSRRDPARFDQAYRAWLADFAARQVSGIGFGYVLLRRPAPGKSAHIRRIEHIDTPVHRPLGGHISAVLEQVDALGELSDEKILAQHFERAPDVTEERYATPGAADPTMIFLRQGDGYGRSMQVSTWQSAFAGACDGELSAGQICGALAELGQLEVAAVIAEVLPFIDTAVWGGFLTLADSPAG